VRVNGKASPESFPSAGGIASLTLAIVDVT
jgi:hypothetical protein